ncbi:homeodomain-like domain protein [Cystoisospora suis]|uniref:Homeodomain-like domain protein n=1 Tax=Cystoisospora suis TaxID=483139 RepID=A0A2C6K8E2_9APIC|nr:homeodomain-like domain protein [Cystoisospora suis]
MGFNVDEVKAGPGVGNSVAGSDAQTPEDGGFSLGEEGYSRKPSCKVRSTSKIKSRLSNGVAFDDPGPPKPEERSGSQSRANGTGTTGVGEPSRRGRRGGGGTAGLRSSLASSRDGAADGTGLEEMAQGDEDDRKQEEPTETSRPPTASSDASVHAQSQERIGEQTESDSALLGGPPKGEKRKAEAFPQESSAPAPSAGVTSSTEETSGRRYAFREKRQKRERFEADISAKKSYTAVPTGYSLSSSDLAPEQVRGLQLFVYRRKSRPYRRRRGDGVLDTSRQEATALLRGGSSELGLDRADNADSFNAGQEENPASGVAVEGKSTEEGSQERGGEDSKVYRGGGPGAGTPEGPGTAPPQTSIFRKRHQGRGGFRYEKNGYYRSSEGPASQRGGRGGGFKATPAGGGRLSMGWRGEGSGGAGKTTASVEGRKKTGGSKSPDTKVREGHGTGASVKKATVPGSGERKEGGSPSGQHREEETDNDFRVPEDIAQVLEEQFHSEPQAVDEYVPFGLYYDDALVTSGDLLRRQAAHQKDRYLSLKAAFQEEMCRRLSLRPKKEREGMKTEELSGCLREIPESTSRILQDAGETSQGRSRVVGRLENESHVEQWETSESGKEKDRSPRSSGKMGDCCPLKETLNLVKKEESEDSGKGSTPSEGCSRLPVDKILKKTEDDKNPQLLARSSLCCTHLESSSGGGGEEEKLEDSVSVSLRGCPSASPTGTEGERCGSHRQSVGRDTFCTRSDSSGDPSLPCDTTVSDTGGVRKGAAKEDLEADGEQQRQRKKGKHAPRGKTEPPDGNSISSQPSAVLDSSRQFQRETDTQREPPGVKIALEKQGDPSQLSALSSLGVGSVPVDGKEKDREEKQVKTKSEENEGEEANGLLLYPENAWTAEGPLEEVLNRERWERDDEENVRREATKRLRSSAAFLLNAAAHVMTEGRPFYTSLAAASLSVGSSCFLSRKDTRRPLSTGGRGVSSRGAHPTEEDGKDTEASSDTGRELASTVASGSPFSVQDFDRQLEGDHFSFLAGCSSRRCSTGTEETGAGALLQRHPRTQAGRAKAASQSCSDKGTSFKATKGIRGSQQEEKHPLGCREPASSMSSFLLCLAKRRRLLRLSGQDSSQYLSRRSSLSPCPPPDSPYSSAPKSCPVTSLSSSSSSSSARSVSVSAPLFSTVKAQSCSLQPVLKAASSSVTSTLLSLSPFAVLQGIPGRTVLSSSSLNFLEKEFEIQDRTELDKKKTGNGQVKEEGEPGSQSRERTKEETQNLTVFKQREKSNEEVPISMRSTSPSGSPTIPSEVMGQQGTKQVKREEAHAESGAFPDRGVRSVSKGSQSSRSSSEPPGRRDAPCELESRTLREASKASEESGRASSLSSSTAGRASLECISSRNNSILPSLLPFKVRRGRRRKSFLPKHLFFDSRTFAHSTLSQFTHRPLSGVSWYAPLRSSLGPHRWLSRSWRRVRAILRAACVKRLGRLKLEADQRQEAFYVPPSDDWEALGTVLRVLPSPATESPGGSRGVAASLHGTRERGVEGILFSSSSSEDGEDVDDCQYHTLSPFVTPAESDGETGKSSSEDASRLPSATPGGRPSIHDLLAVVQASSQVPTLPNTTHSPLSESSSSASASASSVSPSIPPSRQTSSAGASLSGPGLCPSLSSYTLGMQSPGAQGTGPQHQPFLLSRAILRLRQEEKRLLTPPPLPLKPDCLSEDFQQIARALWEDHQGCFVVPDREKHWRIIDGALDTYSDKLPKGLGEARSDGSYKEEKYPDHLPFSAAQLDRFHFFPSEKQEFERRRKAHAASQAGAQFWHAPSSSPSSASPSSSSSPQTPMVHLARAPTLSSRSSSVSSPSPCLSGVFSSSSPKGGVGSTGGGGGMGDTTPTPAYATKVPKTSSSVSAAKGGTEKGLDGAPGRNACCSLSLSSPAGFPGDGMFHGASEVEASGMGQKHTKTPQQSHFHCYQSQCAPFHKHSVVSGNGKHQAVGTAYDTFGGRMLGCHSSDSYDFSCTPGMTGGGRPGIDGFSPANFMGPTNGGGVGGLSSPPATGGFVTYESSSSGVGSGGNSSRGPSLPCGNLSGEGGSGGGAPRSGSSSLSSTGGGGTPSASLQRLQRDAASNPEVDSDIQQLLWWRWRKEGGMNSTGTGSFPGAGGGGGATAPAQGGSVDGGCCDGGDVTSTACGIEGRGSGDGESAEDEELAKACKRTSGGSEWKKKGEREDHVGKKDGRSDGEGGQPRSTGRSGRGSSGTLAGEHEEAGEIEDTRTNSSVATTTGTRSTSSSSAVASSECSGGSSTGAGGEFLPEGTGGERGENAGGGRPRRTAAGHRLADVLTAVKGGDRGADKGASQGAPPESTMPVTSSTGAHTYQSLPGHPSSDSPSSSFGKNPSSNFSSCPSQSATTHHPPNSSSAASGNTCSSNSQNPVAPGPAMATSTAGDGCSASTMTAGTASTSAPGGMPAGPPPLKCLLRLLRTYPLSVVAQRLGVHRSTVARWVKVWPKQQEGLGVEDDTEAEVETMSQDDP